MLQVPQVRTTSSGKNSFSYATPVLWNFLPEHFRTCNNFNQFKQLISNHTGKDCKCVICKT